MAKTVSILGATGSIGTQALEVLERTGDKLYAITGHKNAPLLEQLVRRYRPQVVGVTDDDSYRALKTVLADMDITLLGGSDVLSEIAAAPQHDTVLNALVGMVGLLPTLAAIDANKAVLLANKETLVVGGDLVMSRARENGVAIIPVDSEHSAIFQCLQGEERNAVKSIILTASGGPFFGKTRGELQYVTVQEALNHPSWTMGAKITIDSATLMNKGFELIEAVHLFGTAPDDVQIVVHRESVIHSLVEYADNSCIAQLSPPDMKLPIQYALTYPDRIGCDVKRLSLADIGRLTFYPLDEETFGCVDVCRSAIREGGTKPAAINGANEEAVALFLAGKIPFLKIEELVVNAYTTVKNRSAMNFNDVLLTDSEARECVLAAVHTKD